MFGKESKKKELVNNLGEIYQKIEREHQISPGDFPSLRKMQVWPPRMYPLWALGCQGVRRWRGEAGGGAPGQWFWRECSFLGWGLPKWKQLSQSAAPHPNQKSTRP